MFSFVEGTWATALYQESLPDLRLSLHQDLLVARDEMKEQLDDIVTQLRYHQAGNTVDPHNIIDIMEKLPLSIKESIQIKYVFPECMSDLVPFPYMNETKLTCFSYRLLNFLEEHSDHLPGYQVPPPDK